MTTARIVVLGMFALAPLLTSSTAPAATSEPIDIGSRLELFVDDYLIDRLGGGVTARLHHPTARETVLDFDAPWEGSGSGYPTVFRDGDTVRMYYRGTQLTLSGKELLLPHPHYGCYAQSKDGIHWTKPNLGIFEVDGTKENNLVSADHRSHNFVPFKDTNPDCKPDAKYKAVGGNLFAFKSADAIHWSEMSDKPIITGCAFDSQNLAFWDTTRQEYRAYFRDFREECRDIKTATSNDFLNWTTPRWLKYPGAPEEQLYTNQIKPYYRAPHLFIGFPTRYIERDWSDAIEALPDLEHRKLLATSSLRYGAGLTEGLLMTSRDGVTFKRWDEAFLRPGPERTNQWKYGDNFIAWHVLETESSLPGAPRELSLYAKEGTWTGTSLQLRRYTLRIDGFVSIEAPLAGGELITKPLTFKGDKLAVNFSTSAAGSIRVEIQTADGVPIPNYTLADCPGFFGDSIERIVTWNVGSDVGQLSGQPVRLRFVLKDADLYSIRFQ